MSSVRGEQHDPSESVDTLLWHLDFLMSLADDPTMRAKDHAALKRTMFFVARKIGEVCPQCSCPPSIDALKAYRPDFIWRMPT